MDFDRWGTAPFHLAASCLQIFLLPFWEFACDSRKYRWKYRVNVKVTTEDSHIPALEKLTLKPQRCACVAASPKACHPHSAGPASLNRLLICTCPQQYLYTWVWFMQLNNVAQSVCVGFICLVPFFRIFSHCLYLPGQRKRRRKGGKTQQQKSCSHL